MTGVITDIDGTLVDFPNDRLPRKDELERFQELTSGFSYLGYATGRTYEEALTALSLARLPTPHFWVCSLGIDVRGATGNILYEPSADDLNAIKGAVAQLCSLAENFGGNFEIKSAAMVSATFVSLSAAKAFQESVPKQFETVLTESAWGLCVIDIIPFDHGKAKGIQKALAALNRTSTHLYFGDADNDLCALVAASFPVLMPNASCRVRRGAPDAKIAPHMGLPGVNATLDEFVHDFSSRRSS